MKLKLRTTKLVMLMLLAVAVPVASGSTAQMRADFVAAEQARTDKEPARYQQLKAGLKEYPLYSYLEYTELKERFDKASAEEIKAFMEKYRGTAPAELIRGRWLESLAKQKAWKSYLAAYDKNDENVTRKCHYLNALINTGKKSKIYRKCTCH